MTINKTYTREIKDNTSYDATWLPFVKIALGDVGVLSGYQFIRVTSLGDLGISFKADRPAGAKATFKHTSEEAVTIDLKLAGQAPAPGSLLQEADAGIIVRFRRARAVVFRARDCQHIRIEDQAAMYEAILAAHRAGRWQPDYVAVTEVLLARATTVLISNGDDAKVELRARAALSAPELDLANAQAGLSVLHESQMATSIIAEGALTPLFRSVRVRQRWFRPDIVREPGPGGSSEMVVPADYDDFSNASSS